MPAGRPGRAPPATAGGRWRGWWPERAGLLDLFEAVPTLQQNIGYRTAGPDYPLHAAPPAERRRRASPNRYSAIRERSDRSVGQGARDPACANLRRPGDQGPRRHLRGQDLVGKEPGDAV